MRFPRALIDAAWLSVKTMFEQSDDTVVVKSADGRLLVFACPDCGMPIDKGL